MIEVINPDSNLEKTTQSELSDFTKKTKNRVFDIIWNKDLTKQIIDLKEIYKNLEIKNSFNIKTLLSMFKNKEISLSQFQEERKIKQQELIDLFWEINSLESSLRLQEIKQNNDLYKLDESILEIKQNIDDLIWKNIQNWWSNAFWVYQILNSNLILIQKTIWSFEYLWDLWFFYSKIKNSKNIPKVKDVFIKDNKTFIIMEKSLWKQIDTLTNDEILDIPIEHFLGFIENLKTINDAWLCIDPSKTSNFFYDKDVWFIFIDLSKWENSFDKNILEKTILASILWNISNPPESILDKVRQSIWT